ncbi:hypothetical protein M409DRAFT_66713 [Zasmidium cellare ATCC 36951]|uniref:VOC domain-containing protein n=1 Tax=Zasmidium cellare ATCC 36951 TaxID=1080233 RepID=A0A6A6CGD5_ZASCE|nr:uncharacterized protein M409DRAFT_66713 [Zasmidium cellare ATCC 36951]KAF2166225.1 hypothetical protein M409DRAFT_66713 [Zasmidium cellare ATCC 36951]
MPMSHFGLTVSHIPSATSFYLSALQPLGYRFIGHQGDSIGLGIDSADFFLTQAPIGTRPSPNHIAFLAESRLIVRDCYTAALNSGALPSGAPNYRNEDCSCFNAAVEDLDGNTVEFIFRQPHGEGDRCDTIAPPEDQRVLTWQKDVASSAAQDDAQSVAQSMVSRGSLASKTSRAKSRMQTALDLASSASKSVKSEAPSQGISRSSTTPAKSDFPSKTLIGTALGAAAGAAIMFAMSKAESDNARDEAEHLAYMSKSRPRRRSLSDARPPPPRAETIKESMPPTAPPKPDSRRFHRNYSTTESQFSRRPPPPPTKAMRMIEATGHNTEDEDIQEALSRYSGMKAMPTRSRTIDDYEYAPKSRAGGRSEAPSGHSMKRATTLPVEAIEDRPNYYLEAPPPKSYVSRHSSRHDTPRSHVSGSRHSSHAHRRSSHDDANLKRHDSGISMHSSRSRRDRDSDAGRRSSGSKASTTKPPRRDAYDQAAAVAAAVPQAPGSKAPSSCFFPAAISLPPSHASSKASRSHAPSTYVSAPQEPLEPTASKQSWEDFVIGEESDGLGDIKTVLPEDSISCVDLSKPKTRRESHSSSRHSRPKERRRDGGSGGSRHTVMTALPYRGSGKERDGKRSILGFA